MKARYINSCKDITLYDFIKVYEDKEYYRLRRSLFCTKKGAQDAWDILLDEFNLLLGGNNQNHILVLVKYVAFMEGKINLIIYCLRSLQKGWDRDLAQMINSLGIRRRLTINKLEQGIRVANSELKRMQQSLEEKNKELENLTKDKKGFEFEKVLIDLSKFQGYHINSREISAFEFCKLVEGYKDEAQKIKNNKKSK